MPAQEKISKITLPNGTTYYLEDENIALTSSYDANTKTVTLTVISENISQE